MAEFIEVLSKQAKADIDLLITKLEEGAKAVNKINAEFAKVTLPSEVIAKIKETNKLTKEQLDIANKAEMLASRQITTQQKKIDLEAKEQRAKKASIQTKQAEIRLSQQQERIAEREQKRLNRTTGLYNELQQRVNRVTRSYNDLAVKKQMNGKLSNTEQRRLAQLQSQLTKYNDTLKKVDSDIGKYQRNVGNYASGWNGLGNSINQLTREAPAFANSIQTGFMALSNNIPILIDEINRLKLANQQLAASGKPTTSVFKQILSSLFSWQTAMSLAITVAVLYAKEIGNMISKLAGANNATVKLAKTKREYNTELAKTTANTKVEIAQLNSLIKIARDETQSREKRNEALTILQNKYPDYLQNIKLEEINSNKAAKAINNITKALENKAKVQAAENLITQKAEALLEKQVDIQNDLTKIGVGQTNYSKERAKLTSEVAKQQQLLNNVIQSTPDNQKQNENYLKFIELQNKKIAEAKTALEEFQKVDQETWQNQEIQRLVTERTQGLTSEYENSLEIMANLLNDMPSLYDVFGDDIKADGLKAGKEFAENIKEGVEKGDPLAIYDAMVAKKRRIAEINKEIFGGLEEVDQAEKEKEINDELEKRIKILEQIALANRKAFNKDLFMSELAGLTNMLNINLGVLSNSFDTLTKKTSEFASEEEANFQRKNAIAQASAEVINGIGQTIFQNEQIRLQNQLQQNTDYYNNLISQAQGNAEQQELLRREQAQKENAIRREMAEKERQAQLFDILINTASAVVKALPNIPLSIAVGAIGAAKAALVASQPIPQFKHGRKGGQETWAILGDGYKNEPVVDKHGNLKAISPNRPTMMHLDKGDSVLPSMDRLSDEILAKTMLLNVQAGANKMASQKNDNRDIERALSQFGGNIEKRILKSLQKAKFVNNNNTKVDLGHEMKIARYKGKI